MSFMLYFSGTDIGWNKWSALHYNLYILFDCIVIDTVVEGHAPIPYYTGHRSKTT